MNAQEHEELLSLASSYTDGQWDDEKEARFEAMLKADPEARRVAANFLHDHAALYWEFVEADESNEQGFVLDDELGEEPASSKTKTRLMALGMAACLALALFFFFQKSPQSSEPGQGRAQIVTAKPHSQRAVAHVLRLEGQLIHGGGQVVEKGSQIQAGSVLEMKEGLLELAFKESDVHVIATAPLKMTVSTEECLLLENGEVKLHVPPQGIGFVVETKERKITDLGTSFVVSAHADGSKVLVLDGEIAVEQPDGGTQRLMKQGEVANFQGDERAKIHRRKLTGIPSTTLTKYPEGSTNLSGCFYSIEDSPDLIPQSNPPIDHLGEKFLPLIESGFQSAGDIQDVDKGQRVEFQGIAGSYSKVQALSKMGTFPERHGWIVWHHGKVSPPQPGRYRFWGYADNHLLVAINGVPVFDGSRFGSALREEVSVIRKNYPSFPCLNAEAGFSCGEWIEIGDDPVTIDILFGEMSNPHTSGLLLIEKEGETYPKTFWGQPKWPLFLTERPSRQQLSKLNQLNTYLSNNLKGAFTISAKSIWKVSP